MRTSAMCRQTTFSARTSNHKVKDINYLVGDCDGACICVKQGADAREHCASFLKDQDQVGKKEQEMNRSLQHIRSFEREG
jgi:hypothetical protein